jgi:hypothetical protein
MIQSVVQSGRTIMKLSDITQGRDNKREALNVDIREE